MVSNPGVTDEKFSQARLYFSKKQRTNYSTLIRRAGVVDGLVELPVTQLTRESILIHDDMLTVDGWVPSSTNFRKDSARDTSRDPRPEGFTLSVTHAD